MLTIRVVSLDGEPLPTPVQADFGRSGGTIGRSKASDLVLDDSDRQISRRHAAVEEQDGRFVIRAIGNYPIVLNGKTLPPHEASALVPGDRIQIGRYLLEVLAAGTRKASDTRRPPSRDGQTDELLRAFLEGAGVRHLELPDGVTPELMHRLGELLRTTLQGALDLSAARPIVKHELRANVTVDKASEINPLKFAPTVEDALANLLVPQSGRYMRPMRAVNNLYAELRAQEIAVAKAIGPALTDALRQLNPQELEKRLTEKEPIRSLLVVSRKAMLWDRLTARHQDMADEALDNFHAKFGAEFDKVYEQEIAKDAAGSIPSARLDLPSFTDTEPQNPFDDFFGLSPTASRPAAQDFDPFGLPAPDDRTALTPAVSPPAREDVKLGVAAPSGAAPGQQFIAHFVAYPAGHEKEVLSLLGAQSPTLKPVLGKRTCRWEPGTTVAVHLSADYLEIDHAEQTFMWSGVLESIDFGIKVKTDAPDCDIVLKYDVFVAEFLVAAIRLPLRLSRQPSPVETVSATTHSARTGFASYSSNDRTLVTHMVGAIERSAGISVFQDCLDLKASEEWKPRLTREIGSRDLFFLFWSHSAAESAWVEWEWKTALNEKGKGAMRIHPLEPNVRPPSALEDLHFADVHSIVADYFAKAAPPSEAN